MTPSACAAILPNASLSGYVFVDANANGIMDNLEWAIADAQVWLMQSGSDSPIATTLTTSNGSYHFNNLSAGDYSIQLQPPPTISDQNSGNDRTIFDQDGTSILSTGSAGTVVPNSFLDVTLGTGQTGANFNFAAPIYPVELMSARMLLNTNVANHFTQAVAVPSVDTVNGSSLDLGSVLVGTSGTTSLIVTNVGGQGSTLSGSFSGASGVFSPTSPLSFGPLNSGDIASQDFSYTPTARGLNTQDIAISTDAGNLKVTLSGTGVAPISSLSQITAGYVLVGGTNSSSGSITVTNIGDGNLAGEGDQFNLRGTVPGVTGIFSTSGGTMSLKDNTSQNFGFTYTPTVRTGTPDTQVVSIAFDNGNPDGTNAASTGTVSISGTAVAPVGSLTSVNPGYTLVGGTNTGSITVTNIGDGNLSGLGDPSNLHGSFSAGTGTIAGSSGTISLGDNLSQTFNYTYAPTIRGANSTVIHAALDNGSTDGKNTSFTQDITLNGTGVAPVFSMSQVDAGVVLVGGTASGSASITLHNIGDGNLAGTGDQFNLFGILSAGTASFTGGSASVSLTDNASQTYNYVYNPTTRGDNSAVITATFANGSSDEKNSAFVQNITLNGKAVAPVSTLSQQPSPLYVLVGGSASGSITVQNTGDGNQSGLGDVSNLHGSLTDFTGLFSGTGGSLSLADGATQTFGFNYTSTTKGTDTQDVAFSFDNGNPDGTNTAHSQTITVTGTAVAPVSSVNQASPAYVLVGSTGSGTVTVKNVGNGNLSGLGDSTNLIGDFTGFSGIFSGKGGTLSLADGASQVYTFTYTPATKGSDSQDITFNFSDGSPDGKNTAHTQTLSVTGTGVAPISALSQTSVGNVLVGGSSTGTITVQNTGNGNLSGLGDISNLHGGLSDYTGVFSGTGGTLSLADGASQNYSFTYTPTASGTSSQVVTFNFDNGSPDGMNTAHPQTVTLTGTGVAPIQQVDTSAANAGLVRIGTSGTASVTVHNIGNGNLSGLGDASNLIGSVTPVAGKFGTIGGSISLQDNGAQTIKFTYKPTDHTTDSLTTPIVFQNGKDDGSNLAQTVNAIINGQGVGPVYSSSVAPGTTLDFGLVSGANTKTLTLTLSNISTDPNGGQSQLTDLTILSASISGTDQALFSIGGLSLGTVLHENDSLPLNISYNGNGTVGEHVATLTVITDEGRVVRCPQRAFLLISDPSYQRNTATLAYDGP